MIGIIITTFVFWVLQNIDKIIYIGIGLYAVHKIIQKYEYLEEKILDIDDNVKTLVQTVNQSEDDN